MFDILTGLSFQCIVWLSNESLLIRFIYWCDKHCSIDSVMIIALTRLLFFLVSSVYLFVSIVVVRTSTFDIVWRLDYRIVSSSRHYLELKLLVTFFITGILLSLTSFTYHVVLFLLNVSLFFLWNQVLGALCTANVTHLSAILFFTFSFLSNILLYLNYVGFIILCSNN